MEDVISILKTVPTEKIIDDVRKMFLAENQSFGTEEYKKLKTQLLFRKIELEKREFANKQEIVAALAEGIRYCDNKIFSIDYIKNELKK